VWKVASAEKGYLPHPRKNHGSVCVTKEKIGLQEGAFEIYIYGIFRSSFHLII